MKKILISFALVLSAACSDKAMERDILTAFERHSYEAHSPEDILKELRAGGPAGLKALDSHLELLKTEKKLKEMPGGGLSSGLLLGRRAGSLYIAKVFRGTPADEAGLKEGDRIIEVDGETPGASEAARKIRESVGFSLKAARRASGGRTAPVTADIRKKYLVFPLVFGFYDPFAGIAYVRVAMFTEGSGAAVLGGLRALGRLGARKVVFDLRGTAGGVPDEAAEILKGFSPGAAPVFGIRSRHAGYRRVFRASERGEFAGFRSAVLVNSRTAMAAEVFAAALKELNGAMIIGRATRGDVSLTRIFRAGRHAGLQLTVARLFPPSGAVLEKKGVEPDTGVSEGEGETARAEWSAAGETALLNDAAWRKACAALNE